MERILSFARERAKLIDLILSEATSEVRIDCGKGCTYCCYGVPLWVRGVEVFHLLEGVNNLSIKQRKEIATRLRKYYREYRSSAQLQDYNPSSPLREGELDIERIGNVCGLGMNEVPCPFLDPADGACTVYGERPSMCRLTLFSDREVCRKDWENPLAFIWKNEIQPFQQKIRERFFKRWREGMAELARRYPDIQVRELEETLYFLPMHLSFDPVKKRFKLRGMGQGSP